MYKEVSVRFIHASADMTQIVEKAERPTGENHISNNKTQSVLRTHYTCYERATNVRIFRSTLNKIFTLIFRFFPVYFEIETINSNNINRRAILDSARFD